MQNSLIYFQKHLLICGKTEQERNRYLHHILASCDLETFRFPASMKSFNDYLKFVRSKELFSPSYETKAKYNLNQILDFHIDWIAENSCLFIFEEFHKVDDKFRLEILRIMINILERYKKSAVKIIVLLEDETELIQNLNTIVNPTQYKTQSEVVKSNLQIIAL